MKQQYSNAQSFSDSDLMEIVVKEVNKLNQPRHVKDDVVQEALLRILQKRNSEGGVFSVNKHFVNKVVRSAFIDLLRKRFVPGSNNATEEYDDYLHGEEYSPDARLKLINLKDMVYFYQQLLIAIEEELQEVSKYPIPHSTREIMHEQAIAKTACLQEMLMGGGSEKATYHQIAQYHGFITTNPCMQYKSFVVRLKARLSDKFTPEQRKLYQWSDRFTKKGVLKELLENLETWIACHHSESLL